jgi:hypothetical protein
MAKARNFKSGAAYDRWVAYGHAHGVMNGKGRIPVKIKGKTHKVHHLSKHKATIAKNSK